MLRNIYVLQCIRNKNYAFEILRCNENNYSRKNNYSRMMKKRYDEFYLRIYLRNQFLLVQFLLYLFISAVSLIIFLFDISSIYTFF